MAEINFTARSHGDADRANGFETLRSKRLADLEQVVAG